MRPFTLGGQQCVQLAQLTLVTGSSEFGPRIIMHGIKGDGEPHASGRPLQLNHSGNFLGCNPRDEVRQSLERQSGRA